MSPRTTETYHEVGALTPRDRQLLFHGRQNLWGTHGLGAAHLVCRPPSRRFVTRDDLTHDGGVALQEVVCHVGVGEAMAVINGGAATRVCGIGGVVTRAGAEGCGYATRLLRHVVDTLVAEDPTRYQILFCLAHRAAFYRARAWYDVVTVTVQQPTGPTPVVPPYYTLHKRPVRAPLIETLTLWSLPW